MKKIVLLSLLVGTSAAHAQLRTTNTSSMDGLRDARKQMEANTESSLLEKLESARLEDERNRREQFESLNFSVVQDQNTTVQAPVAAPTEPAFN